MFTQAHVTVRMTCTHCDGAGREAECSWCDPDGFRELRFHADPEDIGVIATVHEDDLDDAVELAVDVAHLGGFTAWDYPRPLPACLVGLIPEGPSKHDFEYVIRNQTPAFEEAAQ